MPRDGSGVYTTLAGTHGIPDTTIASMPYNLNVDDVATDLNAPRPIIAGGTGANSAAAARTNLATERSNQVVTNFSSHVWEFGSFSSAAGATGAPTANAFSGIAYGTDSNNLVVEARDRSTGIPYVRRKVSGAWQGWVSEGADQYVNVSGDTMTGALNMSAALNMNSSNINLALSATPNWSQYVIFNGGASAQPSLAAFQWSLNITEHNVAARYSFDVRANGVGATFYRPLTMEFSGSQEFSYAIAFDGNDAKKPAIAAFGSAFTIQEYGVQIRYTFDLDVGFTIEPTTASTSPVTGALVVKGGAGIAKQLYTGGAISISDAAGTVSLAGNVNALSIDFAGGGTSYGIVTKPRSATYPTYAMLIANHASTLVGKIEIIAGGGGVAFTSLSDIRLKTAIEPYQNGLAVVEALKVYQYEWAASPGKSYVGLVAQEANEVFPQAVSPGNEIEPGVDGFMPWMLDNSRLVPPLIAAVQELSARVAALEAQLKEANA